MARLTAAVAGVIFPLVVLGQGLRDQQLREAGVCARCHVISVVEWGMSAHRKSATGCPACHGASQAHVLDERNNVKPERSPQGGAIAKLCAECHQSGCPNSGQTASCQNCHHVHALVDPSKPAATTVKDERLDELTARWLQFSRLMEEGEQLVKAERWDEARAVFQAALKQKPGDARAAQGLKACQRRMKPGLSGFEIVGNDFDAETGLPRKVRVTGLGIPMVLVPGGECEMGSERFEHTKPVHTVRLAAFYLGEYEITQAEWRSVMGSNPSAHQGGKYPDADSMPVEQVSWEDVQAFLRKLNEKVQGGGFRLPTEAEWEFAARTGGSSPEPAGADQTSPTPVGRGRPDKLGLHGMLGNVWEWCSSLDRAYPFDAADGRESLTAPGLRILRGGGFVDTPDLLDPAFRHTERPHRRLRWNGLRLARDLRGVE